MKLRLIGTEQECAEAVHALAAGFEVREVSSFYPNRGSSLLGRVYVDADPRPPVIRMNAERGRPGQPEVSGW